MGVGVLSALMKKIQLLRTHRSDLKRKNGLHRFNEIMHILDVNIIIFMIQIDKREGHKVSICILHFQISQYYAMMCHRVQLLGPILFSVSLYLCTSLKYVINYHSYADDTLLYLSFKNDSADSEVHVYHEGRI